MIRVLQILPGLDRGGMETFIMNVYRIVDRSKIQFDFLINRQTGDYFEEIHNLGGEIFYIPTRREGYLQYLKKLNEFFKHHAWKYRAVHYHESSLTSLEPLYFARYYGINKRIIHSHNSYIRGNMLHYISHSIGKSIIKHLATTFFGCSDQAIEWMFKGTGVRSKARLILNGIDTQEFKFYPNIRRTVRNSLYINNKKVIGHVGRFMEAKNHRFLIHILDALLKIESDYHLILIGTGELEDEIKTLVANLKLSNNVSFLGVREDINIILQAMDAFVMPSLYEGLPVVLVEAQASGLPVICSDTISSMSKLTSNYHSLSLKDSYEDWATQIHRIIQSTNIFEREKATSQIIKAGFDIRNTASILTEIYSI